MTPRSFRLNTAFNLAGGGLMLLYALLSPIVLTRAMTAESFGAYVLGLQFIPFLMMLATPIQQSLVPRFARLNAECAVSESGDLARASVCFLGGASIVAIFASVIAARLLPILLGWPDEFAQIASDSIATLGISVALTFPVYAVTAYAAGRQNFLWDNLLKCCGPYSGLVLVLTWISLSSKIGVEITPQRVIGLFSVTTVGAATLIGISGGRSIPFKRPIIIKFTRTDLCILEASRGVLWWQICAMLSMCTAPFIVSSVEPAKVAAYSMSASVMSIIAGLSSALAGPFAVKISQSDRGDVENSTESFLRLQRPFQAFLICATFLVLASPTSLFELWVGRELAHQISTLIVPLALANFIRQMTAPYTAAILGLGLQNRLWLSPAAEAAGSVVFGALLGKYFGGTGVAYGVLVAASLRLVLTAVHDLPATRSALRLTTVDMIFPCRINIFKSRT